MYVYNENTETHQLSRETVGRNFIHRREGEREWEGGREREREWGERERD